MQGIGFRWALLLLICSCKISSVWLESRSTDAETLLIGKTLGIREERGRYDGERGRLNAAQGILSRADGYRFRM